MPEGLRVVFAGTPVFARVALDRLLQSRHEVVAVLTQPDRPAGRGQKLSPSPVKERALAAGLPVLQPVSLRVRSAEELAAEPARRTASEMAAEARRQLQALAPDLMVVAAYGLILPEAVLAIPRLGCLNIHASLLPRWRGAAPIVRAIEAGDTETGVGIMRMEPGLDIGPVALELRTPISAADTAATVHDRLAALGAEAAETVLDRLGEGEKRAGEDGGDRPGAGPAVVFRPQAADGVTYARKIDKADARIDWQAPAEAVSARIRAFDPVPGAHTVLQRAPAGEALRLFDPVPVADDTAATASSTAPARPGEIVAVGADGIVVACGAGRLRIATLQRAGGRRLAAADFLRGFPLRVGELLA